MTRLLVLVVLLWAWPVAAQEVTVLRMPCRPSLNTDTLIECDPWPFISQPPDPQRPSPSVQASPTPLERATVGILFGSSSVSMVPVWITASCTTAGTCREVNPVMAWLIGQGPVRAALVKASVSGATHYLVWRLPSTTRRQRWLRAGLASMLLAVNVADAVHDVRVPPE